MRYAVAPGRRRHVLAVMVVPCCVQDPCSTSTRRNCWHPQAEERDTRPAAERVESRAGGTARREGRCEAGAHRQPRRCQQCRRRRSWRQIACRKHEQACVTGRRHVQKTNTGPKAERAEVQVMQEGSDSCMYIRVYIMLCILTLASIISQLQRSASGTRCCCKLRACGARLVPLLHVSGLL